MEEAIQLMKKIPGLDSLFEFKSKKAVFGAIVAIVVLIISCIKYTVLSGIGYFALFLTAGFLKIKNTNKKLTYALNIIWVIFLIIIPLIFCTFLTGDTVFFTIGPARIILNLLCVLFLIHLMMFFTGKWRLSISVISIMLAVLLTVNDIIFEFRGKELYPLDFFSFTTALNVASQYTITVHNRLAHLWFSLLGCLFLQFSIPKIDIQKLIFEEHQQ